MENESLSKAVDLTVLSLLSFKIPAMEDTQCVITLDRLSLTYKPGEVINGNLNYVFAELEKVMSIYIVLKGEAWSDRHHKETNSASGISLIQSSSTEEYIHTTLYLLGTGNTDDTESTLTGTNEFPFTFTLPRDIPASYVGRYGSVEYTLNAVIKRSPKKSKVDRLFLKIFVPFNFTGSIYRQPIDLEIVGVRACFCVSFKSFKLQVSIPKSYFYIDQSIPIDIRCTNDTRVTVVKLKILLIQKEIYYTGGEPLMWRSKVAELETGPITSKTTRDWKEFINLPSLTTANLEKCLIMKLVYELKVNCILPFFYFNSGVRAPIYLGTHLYSNGD